MEFRMQDRMELKALVDFYATESDKNNQDCYVEIFRPDIKLDPASFAKRTAAYVAEGQHLLAITSLIQVL